MRKAIDALKHERKIKRDAARELLNEIKAIDKALYALGERTTNGQDVAKAIAPTKPKPRRSNRRPRRKPAEVDQMVRNFFRENGVTLITAEDLAKRLDLSRSTLNRSIDRMEGVELRVHGRGQRGQSTTVSPAPPKAMTIRPGEGMLPPQV